MWHCEMCGISLDEAIKKLSDPLTMDIDDYLNDAVADNKARLYRYERTQKKPKKTCSKVCGWNYSSHIKSGDPKYTYTNKIFDCYGCGRTSEGGRIMIARGEKVMICRKCHRKKLTNHSRAMWEELNRERRRNYGRQWQRDNPKRMKKYKRTYRKKQNPKYTSYSRFRWSHHYPRCIECGTQEKKYGGFGRCKTCYYHYKKGEHENSK